MAKSRSLELRLERLRELQRAPLSAEGVSELRAALGDFSQIVVARAAAVAGKIGCAELAQDLVASFDRLMVDPIKRDKTCMGKIALIEALNTLDYAEPEVFLRGIRHVQLEPVWGGAQDTAGPLRVACAAAFVRISHPGLLGILVDLLTDTEKLVRVAAAQALGASGADAAVLLLRLKARLGDVESEVIAECLAGLMRLEPRESTAFVAEFLRVDDQVVIEDALLALGNSRWPDAFTTLKAFWDDHVPRALQETTLLALALLRLPAATNFLISLVADAPEDTAGLALTALATLRYDSQVRERVTAAVIQRDSTLLNELLATKFPDGIP